MGMSEMVQCARSCLDCAEICRTAANMVRGWRYISQSCSPICISYETFAPIEAFYLAEQDIFSRHRRSW